MGNVTTNVSVFLIHTLFSIYLVIVVLRLLLAWVRADFYNPLSQFLVKATNPVLIPLRRIIPSIGSIDTASVVLILSIKFFELMLLATITGKSFTFTVLLVSAILQVVELVIWIFIFAIIIQVIMSWVSPGMQYYQDPAASLLHSLTEPLLRPVRRLLPPVGMVDLSPLVVTLCLYVILIVLWSI